MRYSFIALALPVAVMASGARAQSSVSPPSSNDEYNNAYKKAFEKSFREQFRIRSIAQCVASAPKAKAANLDVTPTCTCATDALLATKGIDDLVRIGTSGSTEELKPLVAQCLKSAPPIGVRTP